MLVSIILSVPCLRRAADEQTRVDGCSPRVLLVDFVSLRDSYLSHYLRRIYLTNKSASVDLLLSLVSVVRHCEPWQGREIKHVPMGSSGGVEEVEHIHTATCYTPRAPFTENK